MAESLVDPKKKQNQNEIRALSPRTHSITRKIIGGSQHKQDNNDTFPVNMSRTRSLVSGPTLKQQNNTNLNLIERSKIEFRALSPRTHKAVSKIVDESLQKRKTDAIPVNMYRTSSLGGRSQQKESPLSFRREKFVSNINGSNQKQESNESSFNLGSRTLTGTQLRKEKNETPSSMSNRAHSLGSRAMNGTKEKGMKWLRKYKHKSTSLTTTKGQNRQKNTERDQNEETEKYSEDNENGPNKQDKSPYVKLKKEKSSKKAYQESSPVNNSCTFRDIDDSNSLASSELLKISRLLGSISIENSTSFITTLDDDGTPVSQNSHIRTLKEYNNLLECKSNISSSSTMSSLSQPNFNNSFMRCYL